jgi:hypothetical protein
MALADLDADGYVDIVYPNGHLYWGGPDGFSPDRRGDLPVEGNGVSVADLNRDGYLDLLIPAGAAVSEETPSTGFILWGAKDGYSPDNKTELALRTRFTQSAAIADLNRDGFLDLVFPDVDSPQVDFFWGDATGTYSPERHSSMEIHSASAVEIADLNRDGRLDLIFGGVYDAEDYGRPTRYAMIVWGAEEGYSTSGAKTLEAYESEEQAVADLNRDGYLDIVMSNYHGYTTRSIPLFIYWGGADGDYDEARRTELPAQSSSRVTIADFNQDSWQDIVVFNHQDHGDHAAGTNIFWGGEEGFSPTRKDWIQTFGVHFGLRRDLGNLYDRQLEEEYRSRPMTCPDEGVPARLSWKALTPHGTSVKFQIRSAETSEKLPHAGWRGPRGSDSYYQESGSKLNLGPDARWIQYRAVLVTPDGGSTPYLDEVRIDFRKRGSAAVSH